MIELCYREHQTEIANLYLKEKQVLRISAVTPSTVHISHSHEVEYLRVKEFIENIYKHSYGANIDVNYPVLMSVCDKDGNILSAVGFRCAADHPLFLEQYTKETVEKKLSCPRCEIVEIGNLASAGKGASIFVFAALAAYLDNKGIRYAAVTGTDFLHRYFKRIGLNPYKICDAEISAVENDGQDWGTYYDTRPRVLVGSLENGVQRLSALLGAKFEVWSPCCPYPQFSYLEVAQ